MTSNPTEVRVLTRKPDRTLDWITYAEQAGIPLTYDGPAIEACVKDAELEDEQAS